MSAVQAASSLSERSHPAYDAMAPYYDAFNAHHDYELWLSNLLPAAESFGVRGRRLLDVACGTGMSFATLLDSDWQITAVDGSEQMLRQARRKARGQVRLEQADMRALPAYGEFDLIWALGDALNYLLNRQDLERCLHGLAGNLAPDGLLLFDLNALLTYRTFYAETSVKEADGLRFVWQGQTTKNPRPGVLAQARFEVSKIGTNGGGPALSVSVHRQRHHPVGEVTAALDRAGLQCLAVFGQHFDARLQEPLDEDRHTKAVYFARLEEGR
jgi:SAM-dependent methyltransferase